MPTVLYPDVDGQCDKLVTETVTSLPHWPCSSVDSTWVRSRDMVGAHQNLNGSRDLWPRLFQGWFAIHRLSLATVNLPTKFKVSISTHY